LASGPLSAGPPPSVFNLLFIYLLDINMNALQRETQWDSQGPGHREIVTQCRILAVGHRTR